MSKLEDIYIPVQRIIPFSNVEGKGNRTSIFLQGCNINCLYCHNPETIIQISKSAKKYSLADLLMEIKGTIPFIRGITVSGGEPTIYARELAILFQEVHKLGLTCYIDSNGFFPYQKIEELINNTDQFLFDIKGVGAGLSQICFSEKYLPMGKKNQPSELVGREEALNLVGIKTKEILGRNLQNLQKLLALGKVEEVRLVYIKGYYDEYEAVKQIAKCLKKYPEVLFKLIRVHAKGSRNAKEIVENTPSRQETDSLATFAKEQGINNLTIIY